MLDSIFRRNSMASALGLFTAAILISATSVHPQTTSPSDTSPTSSGSAMQSGKEQSGTMNQGGQSGMHSGTQSSGSSSTSSATDTGKTTATEANKSATATATTGATVSASDRNLMRDLAYANLSEIAIAKLAQSKTSSDQVRNFAQRMIDDHTKAQDQLQQLAQAKGVQLPTAPDAKHQALEKKLNGLSEPEFDREYTEQAGLTEHRNTHRLVARISTQARDADLKTLAKNLMPDIDQHLQMAQQMRSGKTGQTSSGSSGK